MLRKVAAMIRFSQDPELIRDLRWNEKNVSKALARWSAVFAVESLEGDQPSDAAMNPPLEDSDGDEEMIPEPSGENMDQPLRSGLAHDGVTFEVPPGRKLSSEIREGLKKAHCNLGHPSKADLQRVGDSGSEVAQRMQYRYHAKLEYVKSQARSMLARAAHNRVRKITQPRVGQLVFFWRGERKKEPSKWVGPGYVVGLQGPNAWVAVGGRCFLVAGEHLREASGDEKHYGDPQIQKAIALFKKVFKEATLKI
eukprot:s133_g32.t1